MPCQRERSTLKWIQNRPSFRFLALWLGTLNLRFLFSSFYLLVPIQSSKLKKLSKKTGTNTESKLENPSSVFLWDRDRTKLREEESKKVIRKAIGSCCRIFIWCQDGWLSLKKYWMPSLEKQEGLILTLDCSFLLSLQPVFLLVSLIDLLNWQTSLLLE